MRLVSLAGNEGACGESPPRAEQVGSEACRDPNSVGGGGQSLQRLWDGRLVARRLEWVSLEAIEIAAQAKGARVEGLDWVGGGARLEPQTLGPAAWFAGVSPAPWQLPLTPGVGPLEQAVHGPLTTPGSSPQPRMAAAGG